MQGGSLPRWRTRPNLKGGGCELGDDVEIGALGTATGVSAGSTEVKRTTSGGGGEGTTAAVDVGAALVL